MLARSGRLPTSGNYAYELESDGFRAIVSTEAELRVRSRRGWDMTEHVGFLAELPVRAVLVGRRGGSCRERKQSHERHEQDVNRLHPMNLLREAHCVWHR